MAARNGQTFARSQRFSAGDRFYCIENGQSVFCGPGAYEDVHAFKKLSSQPCTVKLTHSAYLGPEESKKQCYIMIGDQIKFEPGLLKKTPDYEVEPHDRSRSRSGSRQRYITAKHNTVKQLTEDLDAGHCLKSFSQAFDVNNLDTLKQLKKMRKARRQMMEKMQTRNDSRIKRNRNDYTSPLDRSMEEFMQESAIINSSDIPEALTSAKMGFNSNHYYSSRGAIKPFFDKHRHSEKLKTEVVG